MTKTPTSYSLLVMFKDVIYVVRDPYGNRPLCIGRLVPISKLHSSGILDMFVLLIKKRHHKISELFSSQARPLISSEVSCVIWWWLTWLFVPLLRCWRGGHWGVGCVIRVLQLPVHRCQVSVYHQCNTVCMIKEGCVVGDDHFCVLPGFQVLQRGLTRRDSPDIQAWSQVSECCPSPWGRPPCLLYIWICLLCQTWLYLWRFEYLLWIILYITLFLTVWPSCRIIEIPFLSERVHV